MIQLRAVAGVPGALPRGWGGRWVSSRTGRDAWEAGPVCQPCHSCPAEALSSAGSLVPTSCGLGFVFPLLSLSKFLCGSIEAAWATPIPQTHRPAWGRPRGREGIGKRVLLSPFIAPDTVPGTAPSPELSKDLAPSSASHTRHPAVAVLQARHVGFSYDEAPCPRLEPQPSSQSWCQSSPEARRS